MFHVLYYTDFLQVVFLHVFSFSALEFYYFGESPYAFDVNP